MRTHITSLLLRASRLREKAAAVAVADAMMDDAELMRRAQSLQDAANNLNQAQERNDQTGQMMAKDIADMQSARGVNDPLWNKVKPTPVGGVPLVAGAASAPSAPPTVVDTPPPGDAEATANLPGYNDAPVPQAPGSTPPAGAMGSATGAPATPGATPGSAPGSAPATPGATPGSAPGSAPATPGAFEGGAPIGNGPAGSPAGSPATPPPAAPAPTAKPAGDPRLRAELDALKQRQSAGVFDARPATAGFAQAGGVPASQVLAPPPPTNKFTSTPAAQAPNPQAIAARHVAQQGAQMAADERMGTKSPWELADQRYGKGTYHVDNFRPKQQTPAPAPAQTAPPPTPVGTSNPAVEKAWQGMQPTKPPLSVQGGRVQYPSGSAPSSAPSVGVSKPVQTAPGPQGQTVRSSGKPAVSISKPQ